MDSSERRPAARRKESKVINKDVLEVTIFLSKLSRYAVKHLIISANVYFVPHP